jgi:hypothetical protein
MEEEGPDLSYLDSLNPAQLQGKTTGTTTT